MTLLSITTIAIGFSLLLSIYKFVIFPIVISPLGRIPNAHWSAPLSSIWINWVRYCVKENRSIYAAHERHGPIVRLGPQEVSVNCIDGGVRTVYGAGFDKSEWYSIFDNYGAQCMFSTLSASPHSARKRMISNVYSKSSIQSSKASNAQAVKLIYDRFLPILTSPEAAGIQGINVWEISMSAAMDFITAYQFGLAHSSNFLQNVSYRQHFLSLYSARKSYTFFSQEHPHITKFVHSLGIIRLYPTWVDDSNREIEAWTSELCSKTKAAIDTGVLSSPEDEPVVMRAVLSGLAKENALKGSGSILASTALANPELCLASEMLDHLAAGMETSGITLTYVTYHLSLDIPLQDQLRAELKSLKQGLSYPIAPGEDARLPDPKELDALTILHAILMETLRNKSAIPGSQPRISPFPSSTLCSFDIPGGTRVSASAYGLHRFESVYPDALQWDHTRWLDQPNGNENKSEDMKERNKHFWAFSSGGKMCIGSNFAVYELKLLIAAIYTNFRTYIVDDKGIEQTDGYTCGPKSNSLMLRFEKIDG